MSAEDQCHKICRSYQRQFPTVKALSSEEYLRELVDKPHLLVDCRTGPEQRLSMIRGAIPFEDVDKTMRDANNKTKAEKDKEDATSTDKTPIVTYCTVGFRSSLDAALLQKKYPDRPVYSLDGIVAYTHAIGKLDTPSLSKLARPLINPATKEATVQVHTFGPNWNCVHPDYKPQGFAFWGMLVRMVQVMVKVFRRSLQGCAPKPMATTKEKQG